MTDENAGAMKAITSAQTEGVKIRGLRVRPLIVPMTEPHKTASGIITESPLILLDVMTDAGIEGHAVIFTYNRAALKPTAALIENLASFIEGTALEPSTIFDSLSTRFRLLGCEGLVAMAISGIDMAAWDAKARLHDVSLAALLGFAPKPVSIYGAVGFDGVAGSAGTAERWAQKGVHAIKLKIGYESWVEDAAVLHAVRSSTPKGTAIMVDYNQSLTPAEAVERIRRLEQFDLTWVEEPVGAHDLRGHAFVAREVVTPIQCGENWWGAGEFAAGAEARASDYVMADVMKIGGVTGWMRAAAIAGTHALRMSNHLWPEISAQLLAATPTAHFLEYADWWNPVVKEPLQIKNGRAMIDGTLGTGVEWNETAIRELEQPAR